MHRSSMFGIKVDLAKSRGSYLYDLNRQEFVMDLFTMFSALPLGYNHPIFNDEAFKHEIMQAASVKVTNCEMATPAVDQFAAEFAGHPSMASFKWFHFSCTGALAIEAAIKTAIDYKRPRKPRVITFKESFHGINSYGGFLTEQFGFTPDIVAFGKKSQTSGIMVQERFGKIFERPVRLEVTWDGDVIDMIRCRYVLRAYSRYNILENVRSNGRYITERLKSMPKLRNLRHARLLIAFD